MVKTLVPTETGRILSTCSVLQVASAAAQFEQARSADKDQGEATVLKWPLEGVLVGQKYFIATLGTVFVSKLRRYIKKKYQKRWIKISPIQSRNVLDFLTEIVLNKRK